ncbi:MAG: suppressor of fused domain protein [Clostridia bacterium]|nr:suppressor of fused domain protein [Clostridia bacterium]
MEPMFSEDITDRQAEAVAFLMAHLGSDVDHMHYIKFEQYYSDLHAVDIAIFEPTKYFDAYVAMTAGLSDYKFNKNFKRSELVMVLPKTWKPIFEKEEYSWPIQLLLDVAHGVIDNNNGTMPGHVYICNNDEGEYAKASNAIGGILSLPEEFPIELFEFKGDDCYVRFMQVIPISSDDLARIEEIGPAKFIEFNLHDSEGPQMRVKLKQKTVAGIDKIIKQNEEALKTKKK